MKALRYALCLALATFANAEPSLHHTLSGKVVTGYQGWFRAEGDASGLGWVHFGRGKLFTDKDYSFDLWPDLSEFPPEERYPSPFKFADGRTADLFSSVHPGTVRRHFRWMKDYGIDGAMLQRFAVGLGKSRNAGSMEMVLRHCTDAANAEGRALTVMYDLSGLPPEKFRTVSEDWRRLVSAGQTKQPCAQFHQGKPLVALWGLGFKDRPRDLDAWAALIRFFRDQGQAVMVGVPMYWRTLGRDSIEDPRLLEVIAMADLVSPWAVGRFGTPEQAAARVDALRDLTEQVHGVRISATTTVRDAVVADDTLGAVVQGTLRGARTLRVTASGSDSYEVEMALDRDTVAYIVRALKGRI